MDKSENYNGIRVPIGEKDEILQSFEKIRNFEKKQLQQTLETIKDSLKAAAKNDVSKKKDAKTNEQSKRQ